MKHRIRLAVAVGAALLLPAGCAAPQHAHAPVPRALAPTIGEALTEPAPWYSLAAKGGRPNKQTPAPTATPRPIATPVATSPYAPAIDAERLALGQRVAVLVNEQRAMRGLRPLLLDGPYPGTPSRVGVATYRSQDMRDRGYFAHTDPDGRSPFWHLTQAGIGYGIAGENIAAGYATPEAVMTAWMNSDGHRANILNANFGRIGVGIAKGGSYGIYWTQIFTN